MLDENLEILTRKTTDHDREVRTRDDKIATLEDRLMKLRHELDGKDEELQMRRMEVEDSFKTRIQEMKSDRDSAQAVAQKLERENKAVRQEMH